MVGSNTVVVDDPELTARPGDPNGPVDPEVHQPLRIVVDSRGRIADTARVLLGESRTLVATSAASGEAWRAAIAATGAEVLVLPTREGTSGASHVDLAALLEECGRRGMLTVLFEGGGVLLGSLFDQRLVDRVQAVIAPIIVGAAEAPAAVAGRGAERMRDAVRLRDIMIEQLGEDTLFTGVPDWGALDTAPQSGER